MRADIEQPDGTYRSEEHGDPECGEDFCDQCGDCLHCHGSEECVENDWGPHRWVIYLPESVEVAK